MTLKSKEKILNFNNQELKLTNNVSILNETSMLPLVITPKEIMDLKQILIENEEWFEDKLLIHGGILFRGFEIHTIDKFNDLMNAFQIEIIPYMFRSSPRYSLADRVYVSTTHPQQREIKMHSESSYSFAWGRKIIFCCITEPGSNGETPIADNRRVIKHLSPELITKFENLGVLYQRNLSSEIGMPVKEVFQMDSVEEIETYCLENNIQINFSSPEDAVIRWKRPAIVNHPKTHEKIWFNHAYFFNKYSILDEIGLEFDDDSLDDYLSSNTFFGDGTIISHDEYLQMQNAYHLEKVYFKWEKGDILFLDNMLTAHGRSPYEGDRKIVVSIFEPTT